MSINKDSSKGAKNSTAIGEDDLLSIVAPRHFERAKTLEKSGSLLAHYTTAKNALRIIRNREL